MEAPRIKRFAVWTPPQRAEAARRLLAASGLLVEGLQAEDRQGGVAFPVDDARGALPLARRLGGRLVGLPDPSPRPPRSPRERARAALEGVVPGGALEALPAGWRRLGDVVVVDLPDALEGWKGEVAAALGRALDASAVVEEGPGIRGRRRRPAGRELLWGDGTETVHREEGLAYHLDPTEVMFSAGNEPERRRMGRVDAAGETVADLFAGIGYFSIPLAARAGAAEVVAVDVNPAALAYLERNARANGVADRVHPLVGDARTLGGDAWAHRAVLGYLPDPSDALPASLSILQEDGLLHYHRTVERRDAPRPAADEVREAAREAGRAAEVEATRTVKSVGPGRVHVVVDARIR